jgi:hypothetical protein
MSREHRVLTDFWFDGTVEGWVRVNTQKANSWEASHAAAQLGLVPTSGGLRTETPQRHRLFCKNRFLIEAVYR